MENRIFALLSVFLIGSVISTTIGVFKQTTQMKEGIVSYMTGENVRPINPETIVLPPMIIRVSSNE